MRLGDVGTLLVELPVAFVRGSLIGVASTGSSSTHETHPVFYGSPLTANAGMVQCRVDHRCGPSIACFNRPLLSVVRQYLFAGNIELFPILLKASQYGEVALIENQAAIALNISSASAPLLFGAALLRRGGAGSEKRQAGGNE